METEFDVVVPWVRTIGELPVTPAGTVRARISALAANYIIVPEHR